MKFLHTADWHIGKRLHEYPLVKEQQDALDQDRSDRSKRASRCSSRRG